MQIAKVKAHLCNFIAESVRHQLIFEPLIKSGAGGFPKGKEINEKLYRDKVKLGMKEVRKRSRSNCI